MRSEPSTSGLDVVASRIPTNERVELVLGRLFLELLQRGHLELADALTSEIEDLTDLLEGDATPLGHVQGAALFELPDLFVWEVDLHRTGLGVDVEIEVVLAGHVETRASR